MPKHTNYRLSTKRRVQKFVRRLNALPIANQTGIAWYDSINTADIYPADAARSVLQTLAPKAFFSCVVRAVGIHAEDEELRHMGILFYNEEPEHPRFQSLKLAPLPKEQKNWALLERQKLHAELVRVIDGLQEQHKSSIRLTTEQLVKSAVARV